VRKLEALVIALLCLLPFVPRAQVVATLTAIDQQIQIGRPFQVELSVRHPEDVIVVFPDSAKEFKPFELVSSKPRSTHTENGVSVDATVFKLFSWEIDSLQQIQLPVQFLGVAGDTQQVMSNSAQLLFLPMIPVYSDTLKLKAHGWTVDIREPFPWLGFLVSFAAFVLVASLLVALLHKPVRKMFRRMRVSRDWRAFKHEHERILQLLENQEVFSTRLQSAWKTYLDRKGYLDLHALTTPELAGALANLPAIDQEGIDALVELGHTRDLLLFANQVAEPGQLKALHAVVAKVLEKEYQRRKEAAEI
jgi:hypothetical protein